jgi:hypothetical protein
LGSVARAPRYHPRLGPVLRRLLSR